jgi:hypothetical protein
VSLDLDPSSMLPGNARETISGRMLDSFDTQGDAFATSRERSPG